MKTNLSTQMLTLSLLLATQQSYATIETTTPKLNTELLEITSNGFITINNKLTKNFETPTECSRALNASKCGLGCW